MTQPIPQPQEPTLDAGSVVMSGSNIQSAQSQPPTAPPAQTQEPTLDAGSVIMSGSAAPISTKPVPSTGENIASGFGSAAATTLTNLGSAGSHIPFVKTIANKVGDIAGLPKLPANVNPYETVKQGIQPAQAQATSTTAGKAGAIAESIAEFFGGDELLKGASLAEKAGLLAKVTKLAESHPLLAKIIGHGLTSLRAGAVTTGQELAHGATPTQALETGATATGLGTVTGAATEGVIKGVKTVAPYIKEIAGESIPVRASQESKLASAAENVAPTKTLSKFHVQQTQPAARRAIGNIASEVGSKEISGQTLAARAKDLGERAEQIKTQSKPVFEKLDELTKDNEMTFSDWQKQESAAYRSGDIEAAKKARTAQENILTAYKNEFAPKDLQNARANWKQASALQDVHESLNTKSIVGPTPIELRAEGTPDVGYVNGKAFSKQILKLRNDGTLTDAGLTPEHIQSLQDLGTLLEKSANVHKFGQLAKLTELGGAGLTTVLHPAAAVAGAKAAVPAYLAQRALGRVMTNPEIAATFVRS